MVKAHRNAPDPVAPPAPVRRDITASLFIGEDETSLSFTDEGALLIVQDGSVVVIPPNGIEKFKDAVFYLRRGA